jgi:hypothetical protein
VTRVGLFGLALSLALAGRAVAQGSAPQPLEPADAPVAALHVALYNEQANVKEPTDSAKAVLATEVLHGKLAELLPGQLVTGVAEAAAERSPSCNAIVSCAREVAADAGARWVVLAKVSKTSNLIWLMTGQLIHVPSGTIILDDSTELKGEPEVMVRAGSRIFAERVARTVKAGGVANNFPNPELSLER